jgi:hypothetical protein
MVEDIDIWRSAKILVDRHGADAPTVTERRASEIIAKGDVEGLAAWKRIGAAIKELLETTPRGSVH